MFRGIGAIFVCILRRSNLFSSLAARALGCFCVNNRDLQLLALEVPAPFIIACLSPICERLLCAAGCSAATQPPALLPCALHQATCCSVTLLSLLNQRIGATCRGRLGRSLSRAGSVAQQPITNCCHRLEIHLQLSVRSFSPALHAAERVPTDMQVRQHQDARAIPNAWCNFRNCFNVKERQAIKRRGQQSRAISRFTRFR